MDKNVNEINETVANPLFSRLLSVVVGVSGRGAVAVAQNAVVVGPLPPHGEVPLPGWKLGCLPGSRLTRTVGQTANWHLPVSVCTCWDLVALQHPHPHPSPSPVVIRVSGPWSDFIYHDAWYSSNNMVKRSCGISVNNVKHEPSAQCRSRCNTD